MGICILGLADRGVAELAGLLVAAHAAGPHLLRGELAVRLAERARDAEDREDGRHAAALLEVVLLGDVAADAARRDVGREPADEAVQEGHVVALRVLEVGGVALAADLARHATDVLDAGRGVHHAVEDAGGVRHGGGTEEVARGVLQRHNQHRCKID